MSLLDNDVTMIVIKNPQPFNRKRLLLEVWMPVVLGALLAVLLSASDVQADIYTYVDKDGVVHLTNKRTDRRYRILIRERNSSGRRVGKHTRYKYSNNRYGFKRRNFRRSKSRFDRLIINAARRNNLDQALVKAVIRAESGFNPNAKSSAGAVGLMQLMPKTALIYGVRNRRDPRANIYAGTRHLRGLLRKYKNNIRLSLAAYNAGEGAVKKYGNRIPPYKETRQYVTRVLRFYRYYRRTL